MHRNDLYYCMCNYFMYVCMYIYIIYIYIYIYLFICNNNNNSDNSDGNGGTVELYYIRYRLNTTIIQQHNY